jgi:hypothetical protein
MDEPSLRGWTGVAALPANEPRYERLTFRVNFADVSMSLNMLTDKEMSPEIDTEG